MASSLNQQAIKVGSWQASSEMAGAIIDDVKEVSGQELDIDAVAVVGALATLRAINAPTIPFLQINATGAEETTYGATLNKRNLQKGIFFTGSANAIKVAGMLLGGINNSSEEQGLYLAHRMGTDADENQRMSDQMLARLAEEMAESDPDNKVVLGLLTPADYILASTSSRRLRNGLGLDTFAVYSYIAEDGALGYPIRSYTLFPQTTLIDGTALLGYSVGDRESASSEFMRGCVTSGAFSVGTRFSIAPPNIVGQGILQAEALGNLTSHLGASIS